VTDSLLYEIFSTIGQVEGCKVIKDKNGNSAGYGFVDFFDHLTADRALQNLNGRKIYGNEIKVNWAYAGGQREDASCAQYHVFVGDLSPEIDDKALFLAFIGFGCSDARVMWDQTTGRSRGYGFVAFKKKEDAERSLTGMNGEWIGNRAVRCNWANQKVSTNTPGDINNDYGTIVNQATPTNATVYVGNISPDISEEQLIKTIFGEYGIIEEVRMQKEKGYAFIRYQAHEQAARAIASVHGRPIGSKVVKCSWGKEKLGQTPTSPSLFPQPTTTVTTPYPSYSSYQTQQPPVMQYSGFNPVYYSSGAAYGYNQPPMNNYQPYMQQGYPSYDPYNTGNPM